MVTKYDIFEYIYNKSSIKPKEIREYFKKNYQTIYKILLELKKNKLIDKNKQGFQIIKNKNTNLLYQIIKFCISNNINYNEILDENLAVFIKKAFNKGKFTIKDFKINPRTFAKYTNILSKYGFLIILSKKPLTAILPYNSFLKDIAGYFGYKTIITKFKEDYVDEIERELKTFRKLSKKNYNLYKRIAEDYKIRFIQHSLNLEGNPITLPDTIKLLKNHIIPKDINTEIIEEVQNYQKATNEMIKDSDEKKPLTKESILNYHYLAMQHKNIAGKLRKIPVIIKNNPDFKIAKVSEINKKIDILLKKYNSFIKKKHSVKKILEFASFFHNEFQHIHPFIDGNSRTTRLITFHLLRSQGIPIFDIPLGLLEEYLFCTKASKKREDEVLNKALQKIILYNLRVINERLS